MNELEEIVRTLAALPCPDYDNQVCELCAAWCEYDNNPGWRNDLSWHELWCPWRRARGLFPDSAGTGAK